LNEHVRQSHRVVSSVGHFDHDCGLGGEAKLCPDIKPIDLERRLIDQEGSIVLSSNYALEDSPYLLSIQFLPFRLVSE